LIIIQEAVAGGLLLRLDGRLDADTIAAAESKLLAAVRTDDLLVLDLARLHYCSSTGLRLILRLLQLGRAKHARIGFAAVQPAVQDVLETGGFDRMMRMFATTGAAIAALK
jgi:anti-sigma B factor antagonist